MTDNDRELLALAAKACSLDMADKDIRRRWNPLHNDGDAFRLAVQLKIWILFEQDTWAVAEIGGIGYNVVLGDAHGAATRRAIVIAAAEIGRGME